MSEWTTPSALICCFYCRDFRTDVGTGELLFPYTVNVVFVLKNFSQNAFFLHANSESG